MIYELRFGLSPAMGAILLSACTANGGGNGMEHPTERVSLPIAAQVAVFNKLFVDNASSLQHNAATYCIDTGKDEAKRQVDAALHDNAKVKPAYACDVHADGKGVYDRDIRQRALMFRTMAASCSFS